MSYHGKYLKIRECVRPQSHSRGIAPTEMAAFGGRDGNDDALMPAMRVTRQ